MEHQTYYVTVVAVIPVLALASILEIRTNVSSIVGSSWPNWRKEVTMLYWVTQAMVTAVLVINVPTILDAIYEQQDPHDHTFISWGLVLMTTMVAFTPFGQVFQTLLDVTGSDESPADRRPGRRSLQREARRIRGAV
jgi:hypothetical protein